MIYAHKRCMLHIKAALMKGCSGKQNVVMEGAVQRPGEVAERQIEVHEPDLVYIVKRCSTIQLAKESRTEIIVDK